jgi:hypothetical protein
LKKELDEALSINEGDCGGNKINWIECLPVPGAVKNHEYYSKCISI